MPGRDARQSEAARTARTLAHLRERQARLGAELHGWRRFAGHGFQGLQSWRRLDGNARQHGERMNELALFAGAGGVLLASHLLGWRTVCAVELDWHSRCVLTQRQNDGHLRPAFPIWDDIRTFDGRPWRGRVDVVSGGFPCQAYSTAAAGKNVADDLWPEMRRVVADVAPRYVFRSEERRVGKECR